MGSGLRRIDNDTRAVRVKDVDNNEITLKYVYDVDGNLVALPAVRDGGVALKVSDMSAVELLHDIVTQLKIMNTHLQIITDEEIKE